MDDGNLRSIPNWRDCGGIIARGGQLRRGILFRSGSLDRASPDDLARVGLTRITDIVDLRSTAERRDAPDRLPPHFAGRVHHVPGYDEARAPHVAAGAAARSAGDVHRLYRDRYARMPFDPPIVRGLRLVFDVLDASAGAVLVHCAAGKDRTGVAVALVQAAVGVHRDEVRAGYLRSRPDTTDESESIAQAIMSVSPGYLDALFVAIRSEAGSVARYLSTVLNVEEERRMALQRRLVMKGR